TSYKDALKFDRILKSTILKSKRRTEDSFLLNTGLKITEKFNDNGGSEIFLPEHLNIDSQKLITTFQSATINFHSVKQVVINSDFKF
ncbi:hypothetical protein, partial [Deferribacter abyssi]|uniref:hypothetical protein n=1 Tax=Deferribacter abyssi TaxID=213806 RepID=UPI003C252DCC